MIVPFKEGLWPIGFKGSISPLWLDDWNYRLYDFRIGDLWILSIDKDDGSISYFENYNSKTLPGEEIFPWDKNYIVEILGAFPDVRFKVVDYLVVKVWD